MAQTLRVDPAVLRSAAVPIAQAGAHLSGMGLGQSLSGAAAAVSGCRSGGALQQAGAVLDGTGQRLGDELSRFSTNLHTAAGRYEQADQVLAGRIKNAGPDDPNQQDHCGDEDAAEMLDDLRKLEEKKQALDKRVEAHNAQKPAMDALPDTDPRKIAYNQEAAELNKEEADLNLEIAQLLLKIAKCSVPPTSTSPTPTPTPVPGGG